MSKLVFADNPHDLLNQVMERAILASTNGIMIVESSPAGLTTVFVNPAFEAITGYARDEVIGKPPGRLHHGDAEQAALDELRQAIAAHRPTRVVLRNYRKDGSLFWNELSVSPVRDGHGRLTHFIGILNDITKAYEIEEIKSEFLATAAHELRTPMASIYGYAELLLKRSYTAEQSRELLEIILRQSQRVTDLLNELLDLARIEARRGKDFVLVLQDLRPIVHGVVAAFPDSSRRIVINMPDEPLLVTVDKEKIHQALLNILGNALKFSEPEKMVSIAMQCRAGQAPAAVGVAIRDQGIGMSAGQLARLGERFFRADVSGKVPGTGLGVSLAKEIAVLHGGTLEASSELGKGSCLTLWLPQALPTASWPAERS